MSHRSIWHPAGRLCKRGGSVLVPFRWQRGREESAVTAKSYDPTLKDMVETEPESWPAFVGSPTGPTTVIDADIATVSGAADKVLYVAADPPYLLHLEFVTGHDVADLPRKLHVRNGLLEDRHDLPVRSVVVLLRPETDSPQLTGVYERGFPGEEPYLRFRYQVVRVWQLPPEVLLTGGLALLPLAPISAVTPAELPGIIKRIEQRLGSRRGRKQAPMVWAAAYILLGLRYSPALAAQLFRGVLSMKESSTYQAILEEGETKGAVAEAKKVLRLQGDDAFGPPDARTAALIERLEDLGRLEDLLKRVRRAGSWQELLGQPAPGPRRGRRRQTP
jgi:predicted transposase YdaD